MFKQLLNRKPKHQLNVLFVCTANICRSPLAEGILRDRAKSCQDRFSIKVDSCGIEAGPVPSAPDIRARNIAQTHAISLKGIKSRRLVEQDFLKFDLILAMDSKHLKALEQKIPDTSNATLRLFRQGFKSDQEIPDPYYGNAQGFEKVFELLLEATDQLLLDTEQSLERNKVLS